MINSYEQWILNFKRLFQKDFHFLCRLIIAENIISLTFSNEFEIFIKHPNLTVLLILFSATVREYDESEWLPTSEDLRVLQCLYSQFRNFNILLIYTLLILNIALIYRASKNFRSNPLIFLLFINYNI